MLCRCIECGLDHCEPMELCEHSCANDHVEEARLQAEEDAENAAQDRYDRAVDLEIDIMKENG